MATDPAVGSRRTRIETLDLMRGLLLLVIVVDHFGRFPNVFGLVTGRGQLWASAAEGFFLISGLLVGHVRGRQFRVGRWWPACRKIWRRSAFLFVCSISLTLFFTSWGRSVTDGVGVKSGLDATSDVGTLLWRIVSLQYIYGWADLLNNYAVFLAAAPAALLLLRLRLVVPLMAMIFAVWWLRGDNPYLGWQVYFFTALVVGYHLRPIEALASGLSARWALSARIAVYGAAVTTVLISATLTQGPAILEEFADFGQPWLEPARLILPQRAAVVEPWFDKWSVAFGGVLIAFLWFAALYVFVRRHENWFVSHAGRVLLPVGRHSLFVYVSQAFLLFGLGLIPMESEGIWQNTGATAAVIATVWVVAIGWQRLRRRSSVPTAAGRSSSVVAH